ncbi:hypothetical protein KCP73_02605 [Salmonella enterica subsp. enterica]|nr:hypothetical protein KCP73_02605 [Salmonella enterica subsp. enterica]
MKEENTEFCCRMAVRTASSGYRFTQRRRSQQFHDTVMPLSAVSMPRASICSDNTPHGCGRCELTLNAGNGRFYASG